MSKVTTLAEAVSTIPNGAHVALPGFATARCAMAFAHEVIRQGIKKLTVSQCVGAMDADILVGAGAVERIIYGGGSRGRSGQHHCLSRAIENGTLAREELSSLSMTFRYLAGALGLPFIPIRSLVGSDILKELQEAVEFCKQKGVEFYAVNKNYPEEIFDETVSRKIEADIYIDDRNIGGFKDWSEIWQLLNPDQYSSDVKKQMEKIPQRRKSFWQKIRK